VLDQTGLSQKNGAVASHVRIADRQEDIHAVRIATGGARLILGCDIVTATAPDSLAVANQGVTNAIVNSYVAPPAAFVLDNALDLSAEPMIRRIGEAAGGPKSVFLNGSEIATALLGDAIATNLFMLGVAFQQGLIPLREESILQAIELNAVAVEQNRRAFLWGRLAAHDRKAVETLAKPLIRTVEPASFAKTLPDVVAKRAAFLTEYQDAAYAERYKAAVARVEQAEREKAKGMSGLAEAVARNLFKLMAYKDEYEVARLYASGEFRRKLEQQFAGDYKLSFHLAPPLFSRRDPQTGELEKREYGPWVFTAFKLLAKLKGLRGTKLDVFGWTEERKTERRLVGEYLATVDELIARLDHDSHALCARIAEIPDDIRGFGHVKERNLKKAKAREAELLALLRQPRAKPAAAE
jgi:indolepyruvate ferredoxin oxidoreductase